MKKILFLLAITGCFAINAQSFIMKTPTFIGKTQDEVTAINKANNNKQLSSPNLDSLATHVIYQDPVLELDYEFIFSKNKICVAYVTQTQNKKTKDDFLKEVEKKCAEKLSDWSWVQKLDGKNYIWNLRGGDTFYAFAVSQSK